MGGVVWPIMLNQLRNRTSFANGIRVTAAVAGFFLLVANVITKSRLPTNTQTSQQTPKPSFRVIFGDIAYLISVSAAFFISLGLFFPCRLILFDSFFLTNLSIHSRFLPPAICR